MKFRMRFVRFMLLIPCEIMFLCRVTQFIKEQISIRQRSDVN